MDFKNPDKEFLKKTYIFLLALIGFVTTIKLAFIYYDANFNKYAMPSFCSVNEFVDCDGIAKTIHSQFLGIPLAYWGMCLYLFIFFLLIVDKLKKIKFLGFLEVFKNPVSYIAALGFISFAISMFLAGMSLFEIKKVCVLCVFTYFINLAIALVANGFSKDILTVFKTSVRDFIDALKIKKYLISFIILCVIAIAALADTSLTYRFTPQVKLYNSLLKYADMKDNPYKIEGNILGEKDSKNIVYIYTDYCCPMCRIYNIMTHKAVKEIKGFKIVHKNFPLDTDCNKYVAVSVHEGACMLAKYAVAAEAQGHFWDMNTALFDKKPKTEADVLKIAKALGLDTKKLEQDADSPETSDRIRSEIDSAMKLGIEGTPALVINGETYVGLKPYDKLKEILIKAGAVEKK